MKRIRLISKSIVALCAIIALSFYVGEAKAQTAMSPQWVLHSQKEGVKIYYSVYRCVPNNMATVPTQGANPNQLISTKLLLKFENQDANTKTVTWNANSVSNSAVQLQNISLLGFGSQIIDCSSASEINLKTNVTSNSVTSLSEALNRLNVAVTLSTSTN